MLVCYVVLYFCNCVCVFFFFFKQKTAYDRRISDWSSDVCSSDLPLGLEFVNSFPSSGGPPVPVDTADLTEAGPGSLVTATTMPGVTRRVEARDLRAALVLYRSTSGDTAAPTVVSRSEGRRVGKECVRT